MKTFNTTTIAALPIGEFDTDLVKNEFDAIIRVFDRPSTNLIVADAVPDEESARKSVQVLSEKTPDLLLIIVLRGLSAQAIVAAARLIRVPILIWPVQGRFSLPSSTLALGELRESEAPVELFYTPPDHPDSIERIQLITRAARAYSQIHQSRIGVIGGLFPNLVSCRYDPRKVRSRLGITLVSISFEEIRESFQSISKHIRAIEQLRQEIALMHLDAETQGAALGSSLKLHLALKQVALEQKIDGFATECWSGFPRELGLNPCMGFIEDAYVLACEGDVMLCVSLLLVRYLTGTSAYAGDLYDLDMDGILTLTHCGAPASLASNQSEVVLAKSQLAQERGFETITCRPRLNKGPVTLFRFYGSECNQLHLARGELVSSELSPNLTVKVKVNGNSQNFLEQCFGNHYVMVSGDICGELKMLGKWLKITIHET